MTNKRLPKAVAELLASRQPQLWLNPEWRPLHQCSEETGLGLSDIHNAEYRWQQFATLLRILFPELERCNGIIESELRPADRLRQALMAQQARAGRWLLKCDHELPVAGSIKARGAVYEVLLHAENLAIAAGLLRPEDDRRLLSEPPARCLFSRHQVAVGSTGNLGLGVGAIAAALGFRATVHMSAEAKEWKKARLRARGVEVIEHEGDFGSAVAAGRAQSSKDPLSYFVDDEQSRHLFLGYSVAALRVRQQIENMGLRVDATHPLFVYIPCGVGGAPSGISFGLRHMFGDNVHCFFAEPVSSPCMLTRLAALDNNPIAVGEIGLDNKTDADGLAVGQASEFAALTIRNQVSGVFTGRDAWFFSDVFRLAEAESVQIEPSAAAGFRGPTWILDTDAGREYLTTHGIEPYVASATHILWTTGGVFVPQEEHQRFQERGRAEWQAEASVPSR